MLETSRIKLFAELCHSAQACRQCPDLSERTAVLSENNGNIFAKVMFVAEAPGRQGGDRTRTPFSGDKSGANFQKFIDSIDLKRAEIFITNSALCNPRKPSGANRRPSQREIKNCSAFLKQQIALVNPRIIASLGSVALEALRAIEYHQISLKNAGEIFNWNGRLLVPLYHPSPQVIASHRRLAEQLEDYKILGKIIKQELR